MEKTAFLRSRRRTNDTRNLSSHRTRGQRFSDSWLPEILALSASIGSLAGIGVILILYNNRPLSSWPQLISLNTALSSLGTIMKGTMLVAVGSSIGQLKWLWYANKKHALQDFQSFDAAARGPRGAALMLARPSLFGLASLGALATVLALLSDAFIQQSVTYPSRGVVQPHLEASVPYAQKYNQTLHNPDRGFWYTSRPMLASFYDGVVGTNLTQSSSKLQPNCPTGNCTSPPYASLAMCTRCMDVSAHLNHTEDANPFGPTNTYALPNGHFLNTTFESAEAYLNISGVQRDSETQNELPMNSNDLDRYVSDGTVANFSIITADPSAFDCTYFFCAQLYQSSSTFHIFQENVTETHDTPSWKEVARADGGDADLGFEAPASFGEHRNFIIDSNAQRSLTTAFSAVSGSVGIDVGGRFHYDTDIAQAFYFEKLAKVPVSDTADRLAVAMTHAMRQGDGQSMVGEAWASEPFIQVQWFWLLQPVVVLLLSTILLGATILQTKRAHIPNWRSNQLATMAYGVETTQHDCALSEDEGVERTGSELNAWASSLNVRLHRTGSTGGGCRLRTEDDHTTLSVFDTPAVDLVVTASPKR